MIRERLVQNESGEWVWVPVGAPNRDPRKVYSTAYSTAQESTALGCHSSQSKDFNEFYKSHGIVGAYHKPDGTCVLDSNHARNRVMEVRGVYDRDAGYSNYAGNASE